MNIGRLSSVKRATLRPLRLNVSSVGSVVSLRIQRRSFHWNRLSRARDIIITTSSSLWMDVSCDGRKSVLCAKVLNHRTFSASHLIVSPYRFGGFDRLVKKNMPGRLFFVIAYSYCSHVACTLFCELAGTWRFVDWITNSRYYTWFASSWGGALTVMPKLYYLYLTPPLTNPILHRGIRGHKN